MSRFDLFELNHEHFKSRWKKCTTSIFILMSNVRLIEIRGSFLFIYKIKREIKSPLILYKKKCSKLWINDTEGQRKKKKKREQKNNNANQTL